LITYWGSFVTHGGERESRLVAETCEFGGKRQELCCLVVVVTGMRLGASLWLAETPSFREGHTDSTIGPNW
jgi:hypothetical protein